MPSKPPLGRIPAKSRSFQEVVADLRHAVCAVMRMGKPDPQSGLSQVAALGSGFFVSSTVFITCYHVVMNTAVPHQDGIRYDLVSNLGTLGGKVHSVSDATIGKNVHLFPDDDLAILIVDGKQDRPYVQIDYTDPQVGSEIGVAGYPIPRIAVINGKISGDGLLFRVARSVVTATYNTTINSNQLSSPLTAVPVIEVNFMFVPGNSGGPIFSATTGRVIGFVHGYQTQKVRETLETVTMINDLPEGMGNSYIHNLTALYSLGIALNRISDHLGDFNVSL